MDKLLHGKCHWNKRTIVPNVDYEPLVGEHPGHVVGRHTIQLQPQVHGVSTPRFFQETAEHVVNLLRSHFLIRGLPLWGKQLGVAQFTQLSPILSVGSPKVFVLCASGAHIPIQPRGPRWEIRIVGLEELLRHGRSRHHYARLRPYNNHQLFITMLLVGVNFNSWQQLQD